MPFFSSRTKKGTVSGRKRERERTEIIRKRRVSVESDAAAVPRTITMLRCLMIVSASSGIVLFEKEWIASVLEKVSASSVLCLAKTRFMQPENTI
jgi:hypothetical protein